MLEYSFNATESLYKSGIECEFPFSSGNYNVRACVTSFTLEYSKNNKIIIPQHRPFLSGKKINPCY